MAILLVLLILVLGYHYIDAIPAEKAALRSTTGWISYARLCIYGLRFIINGIVAYFVFWLSLLAVLGLIILSLWLFFGNLGHYLWTPIFAFSFTQSGFIVHGIVIASIAFNLCTQEIRKKNSQDGFAKYEEIKKQSAILHLIVEAVEQQRLLRVSLKSRKIYIGMVSSEQFERLDMDNIALIPYFSGHRDKDNLHMTLDDNYTTMYRKHGFIPSDTPTQGKSDAKWLSALEQFRIVIRLNEVESLSFFDMGFYSDFGTFHGTDNTEAQATTTNEEEPRP